MTARHFLTLSDLKSDELKNIIQRSIELKAQLRQGNNYRPFAGKMLGLVFEKSSTRTRVSFETAMSQLGGHSTFLSPRDTQLGRGEPIEDTARVLSRMLDGIVVRANKHQMLETFAKCSNVPVINALTDLYHPCQLLADILTFIEHRGDMQGCKVAWIGDGNNMCHSYINASILLDFELAVACPQGYEPSVALVKKAGKRVSIMHDCRQAADAADLVVTDVWASMGHEAEQQQRIRDFKDFKVDSKIMKAAKTDALFMHCLPAHRGEEVSTDVLEGPQSVVWDEAENRLHSQKALLELLLLDE